MTHTYSSDEYRQVKRDALRDPQQVACPRCSPAVGRPIVLKVEAKDLGWSFRCPHCGESATVWPA